jgi:hypothetical protein
MNGVARCYKDKTLIREIPERQYQKEKEKEYLADPAMVYEKEKRLLNDGVYDISNIDYIAFETGSKINNVVVGNWNMPANHDKIKIIIDFKTKYPEYAVAEAYETNYIFFLSKKPTKKLNFTGSGFNYGAGCIINDCPQKILILAEND